MEKLSDSEEIVMRCVWDAKEPIGLMDVVEACKNYDRDWKQQTVSTFLNRLIQKGYVDSYRKGRSYMYSALIDQEEYLNSQMSGLLNFWGSKSIGALVSAFGKTTSINKEDLLELREMLDELAK